MASPSPAGDRPDRVSGRNDAVTATPHDEVSAAMARSRRGAQPGLRRGHVDRPAVVVDDAPTMRIVRTRLLEKVESAPPQVTVVVLSGPAGSGKSALADQLLDADDRPHAVVSLARHSDEPTTLAATLLDAFRALGASTARLRLAVTSDEPTYSATLLPAVEHVVAATGASPYVLVIDDVHLIRDPRCHELLRSVAGAVPVGSRLLVLTRDEPPAWLARLRAEGHLLDIEPRELAFSVSETEHLFRSLRLRPERAEIIRLVEQSEGWAVGLYLTALAMARDSGSATDRIGSVPVGPGTHFGQYLRSEVLDPLDSRRASVPAADERARRAHPWGVRRRARAPGLGDGPRPPAPAQPAGRQARGREPVPLPPSARRATGDGPRG